MNRLLKYRDYNLRPYNMYVAVFEQADADPPVLSKILYNDFPKTPRIIWTYAGAGLYEGEISNIAELDILPHDTVSLSCELLYGQAVDMRVEGLLNESYNMITVVNYLFSFFSKEEIGGKFVLCYCKAKS